MNITVKFANEVEAVKLDVRSLSIQNGRIVLRYMRGTEPTKHDEKVENIERLILDAGGSRALMKELRKGASVHECVRSLRIKGDSVVLEDVVDRVPMEHQATMKELEELEIG
jgi:hypothetical protein